MEYPGRIVVVSADVGAGPDPAAAELARRLRDRGFAVDRLNLLDLLPRPLPRAVIEARRGVRRWLPRGQDARFARTGRSRLSGSVLRALLRPVRRRMRRSIPADTRAVVTTSPAANQLLGPLRQQGRLVVPVITYVTDVVLRPAWLSPGVDVYCAVPQAEVPPAAGIDVRVVQPLGPPRRSGGTTGDAGRRRRGPASRIDPAGLVAEAAVAPGSVAAGDQGRRRTLVDSLGESIGDAAAVVAALIQASSGPRTGR